jgi:membrane-associated phospholipid phosphatase
MRIQHTRTGAASERTPRPARFSSGAASLLVAAVLVGPAATADDETGSVAPEQRLEDPAPVPPVAPPPEAQPGAPPAAPPEPESQPEAASKSTPAGPPPPHTGVKATLKAIPGDFRHLPSRHTLAVLAGGGALALAARPFDADVNAHIRSSTAVRNFFAPGKFIGQGATLVGASFAVYGIGRATDNRKLSHLGMDLLRATIVDGAIVYSIKATVRRDRPTGECCSFPSGHASVTFATAAVLWRHLGWKAAVPTYAVASYVALSRLHDNRHYLSDVIFGSAIGVAVGHTVTLHTLHGHENLAITPMPVPGGMGVMVSLTH